MLPTPWYRLRGAGSHWVKDNIEQKLLQLDDLYPNAGASFPPPFRVKARIVRWSDHDACPVAPHDAIKHSPRSS
jgi:hypothetical protein